jgi:hypothetical protein
MLTFTEYLKNRDPALYESMVNEASWQDIKNFGKKALVGAAAGAAATGLALGAGGVYNAVKGSTPAVQQKQNTQQVTQSTQLSPQSITKIDKNYAPDEILIKKVVYPKDLIRAAQTNQQKWDKDFANLSTDYTGDLGHATRKSKFDKPSLMYVVKGDAMDRVSPQSGAYANTYNGIPVIVMRDTAFKVLPTATSDGVPTQWGKESIAHELRHNTQDFNAIPQGRYQGDGNHQGDINDQESDKGKHYRQDPVEMGVRLAALKNLMTPENINSIADSMPETNKMIIQKTIELSNNDEKNLMTLIMSDSLLKKEIISSKAKYTLDNQLRGSNATYDPDYQYLKSVIDDSLKTLRDKLGQQNHDAQDLLQFYNTIPLEKRGNFFKELIDNYDKVVKSSGTQNRDMA